MKHLKIYDNFDWNEDDFDYEEEEPMKWRNLNTFIDETNVKSFKGMDVKIDTKSYYYNNNNNNNSNPKDVIGHITNIYYNRDLENYTVSVTWDNEISNVYRYSDLIIKM